MTMATWFMQDDCKAFYCKLRRQLQWYHKSCKVITQYIKLWVTRAMVMELQVVQGYCQVCLDKSQFWLWWTPWHCECNHAVDSTSYYGFAKSILQDAMQSMMWITWVTARESWPLWQNIHCKKKVNCDVTHWCNSSSTNTWQSTFSWFLDVESKIDPALDNYFMS